MNDSPIVEDFAVRLTDDHRIEYVSVASGRLAWFPEWEHADRDLRHFIASDVPLGSVDEPYVDAGEDGWRITIFEQGGFVHIEEEGGASFRVPRDRYLQSWAVLIDLFNPTEPV
jgi:hypothetical protein